MSNTSIQTVFKNVKIPAGKSYSFSVTNGTQEDYYSFSVNSDEPSVITLTNGWYGNNKYEGAGCMVTNTGGDATSFNLVLLTVSNGQNKSEDLVVKQLD